MPWTVYKSTDGSAPVHTGAVGSLVALIKACLVTGYGAKSAAGWTEEYTGTNKSAFRNAAGSISRTYLQVIDNGPGSHGAREARLRLYSTMSDVDTGTLPTPTVAQSTPGIVARKSNTADATARAWMILADEKTVIIVLTPGDTSSAYTDVVNVTYAGDPFSYLSADAQGAFIGGRQVEAITTMTPGVWLMPLSQGLGAGYMVGYFVGSHTGVAGSLATYGVSPSIAVLATKVPYPNPADGAVYIVGPYLLVSSGFTVIRGHLRGLHMFCHSRTAVNAGDTVTGTGDLTGKTFILHPYEDINANSGAVYQQVIAFETSTPAASS